MQVIVMGLFGFGKSTDEKIREWYFKGTEFANQQLDEEALVCYNKAIECFDVKTRVNSDWMEVTIDKAAALGNLKKFHEAIDCLDEVLSQRDFIDVKYVQKSLKLKVQCFIDLKEYMSSIECIDKLLEINIIDTSLMINKGRLYFALNDMEKAIECYDEVIDLRPITDEDGWRYKAVTLAIINKHEESLEYFDKAIKIRPENYSTWQNKGGSLLELGREEEAKKCFIKAKEVFEEQKKARFGIFPRPPTRIDGSEILYVPNYKSE